MDDTACSLGESIACVFVISVLDIDMTDLTLHTLADADTRKPLL